MLAKTGLLIVSNPKQIGKILHSVQKKVKNTLYIQLLSALTDPLGHFHPNVFNSWPKHSQTIHGIYSQAATHCQNLDVRVMLSGLKYKNVTQIKTKAIIDLVIFDKGHQTSEIEIFTRTRISNLAPNFQTVTIDSGELVDFDPAVDDQSGKTYFHTVLGGTFDRIHTAHKLLLTEAALRSDSKVTVGVTENSMLAGKILWELIEDLDVRINGVRDFLEDICRELIHCVVPIADPFGPAVVDPTMEMIVVSDETIRGGEKINQIRQERNLPKLDIHTVELIDEPYPNVNEEAKISSSTGRIRLLGTLLKKPQSKDIPNTPYVIGLTGGVASGKSNVARLLSNLGAQTVNCDLIGHDVYKKGRNCHRKIVECFGDVVLTSEGEIDRRVLGGMVFKDADEMKKLNALVWPEIAEEVRNVVKESKSKVIVIEAAVLLMAGWEDFCHEVWTTLVPREEAVRRMKERKLNEEQAIARIESQPNNKSYVEAAHVVICTLWEFEVTQRQVEKAWGLLQQRLL